MIFPRVVISGRIVVDLGTSDPDAVTCNYLVEDEENAMHLGYPPYLPEVSPLPEPTGPMFPMTGSRMNAAMSSLAVTSSSTAPGSLKSAGEFSWQLRGGHRQGIRDAKGGCPRTGPDEDLVMGPVETRLPRTFMIEGFLCIRGRGGWRTSLLLPLLRQSGPCPSWWAPVTRRASSGSRWVGVPITIPSRLLLMAASTRVSMPEMRAVCHAAVYGSSPSSVGDGTPVPGVCRRTVARTRAAHPAGIRCRASL